MLETIAAILTLGGSALGLAKGATDITKDIKTIVDKPDVDSAAVKQLISDLLDRLIRLQIEQMAMKTAALELDKEQRRVDHFKAESSRYTLTRTEQGSLVYELDAAKSDGQPPHCICATCYDKQIKSILQPVGFNTLGCGQCGGQFFKPDGRASVMMGSVRRSSRFDDF